jgi:integrase
MPAHPFRAGSIRGEMIFQRSGSPYWWYDFTVDGQRQRGSTKQTTRSAARQYEAELISRAEEGPRSLRKRIPYFRDYVPVFRNYVASHNKLAPKSKAYYEDGVDLLLKTEVATKRLDQIQKPDIETLTLPDASGSWQNCALRTLRRMLHLAKEWKLIREVPSVPLQEQRQRAEVFDPVTEQRIIDAAKQSFRDIFLIMMDAGCRPSEVIALRLEDMRWDQRLIFIARGKTKKSRRFVPMSDRVHDALRARAADKTVGWVFPSGRTKSHYTIGAVEKEFRRIRAALGLPAAYVPYVARHSFATSALDMTGNIQLVADALGHASTDITSTYLHPSRRGLTAMINARNEQRTKLAMAQSAAQSDSEGSTGTAEAADAMLSQVAVPGQLRA